MVADDQPSKLLQAKERHQDGKVQATQHVKENWYKDQLLQKLEDLNVPKYHQLKNSKKKTKIKAIRNLGFDPGSHVSHR